MPLLFSFCVTGEILTSSLLSQNCGDTLHREFALDNKEPQSYLFDSYNLLILRVLVIRVWSFESVNR